METAKRNPNTHPAAVRTPEGRGLHPGSWVHRSEASSWQATGADQPFTLLTLSVAAQDRGPHLVFPVARNWDGLVMGLPQRQVPGKSSSD